MDGAVACALMLLTLTVLTSCHQVCFVGTEYKPRSGKPQRWFLQKHPCECTAIRPGGMNVPASSYLMGAPYYMDGLFLSEDPKEIKTSFNCTSKCWNPQPLGLEDRTIKDNRIVASSAGGCCPASAGRLNNKDSYWGTLSGTDSWIEVDLVNSTLVAGIITQGDPRDSDRVTKYKVSFRKNYSSALEHVTDINGNIKVFEGNIDDATTPVTNMFL